MNFVMWVLVAVLAGLVAAYAMKRGGYGLVWDIALGLTGSVLVSWLAQIQWASPDPGLVAVILVAAGGAVALIVAQRTIFPARAEEVAMGRHGWIRPGALVLARRSPTNVLIMERSGRMDANRDKRSVGQRWSEARPSKTATFWCCVATAVLTMIVGFSWGGWVTGGTARATAETMAHEAVVSRLAPICVLQSGRDPAKAAKLVALKDESSWQRGDYVSKQGWATMPGEREPDSKVAQACAALLMPTS